MLRLPDLWPTNCRLLVACARLNNADEATLELLAKQERIVARYGRGGRGGYVQAMFGGESNKHFHLELARTRPPSADEVKTCKLADFHAIIEPLLGQEAATGVDGYYHIPLDELPPVIKGMIREVPAGPVSVKVVGGVFALTGTPITDIDWFLARGPELVVVRLRGELKTTIDALYLEHVLSMVAETYTTFMGVG